MFHRLHLHPQDPLDQSHCRSDNQHILSTHIRAAVIDGTWQIEPTAPSYSLLFVQGCSPYMYVSCCHQDGCYCVQQCCNGLLCCTQHHWYEKCIASRQHHKPYDKNNNLRCKFTLSDELCTTSYLLHPSAVLLSQTDLSWLPWALATVTSTHLW